MDHRSDVDLFQHPPKWLEAAEYPRGSLNRFNLQQLTKNMWRQMHVLSIVFIMYHDFSPFGSHDNKTDYYKLPR